MSDGVTAAVRGLPQLMAELQQLPALMRQRVLTGAVATGANIIKRQAVLKAPEWTGPVAQGHPPPGALKAAIYAARALDKCTPTVEWWRVGVHSGKNQRHVGSVSSAAGPTQGNNRDAFYARWVEYGHYTRVSKSLNKSAKNAGRVLGVAKWVPAQPFMRPAFEAKQSEALNAMEQYIRDHLNLATVGLRYLKAAA